MVRAMTEMRLLPPDLAAAAAVQREVAAALADSLAAFDRAARAAAVAVGAAGAAGIGGLRADAAGAVGGLVTSYQRLGDALADVTQGLIAQDRGMVRR